MLSPGQALLCVGSVRQLGSESSPDQAWMTPGETNRAASMKSLKRRSQFIAGHWFARRLAGEFFGADGGEWKIAVSASGQPILVPPGGGDGSIHLSISHSDDLVAVALARFPIGVDVETRTRNRDFIGLAAHMLSDGEQRVVTGVEGSARASAFYRFWTLREAQCKREGQGLSAKWARRWSVESAAETCAEALHWQWAGMSLAIAGCAPLQVQTHGIPATGEPSRWVFKQASQRGDQ